MTQFVSDILERLAPEACVEVFASYGVALTRLPASQSRVGSIPPLGAVAGSAALTVAGFIGFSGSHVRGSVLVATTFNVVARARPSPLHVRSLSSNSSSDWILIRDWATELVNQVMGRIKNRLHPLNFPLNASTPAALSGKALNFAKPQSPLTRAILFDARPDKVWFWFDAVWTSEVAPTPGQSGGVKEGDVILF